MIHGYNPDRLRAFEQRVAEAFNAGRIKAPIHLSDGNELHICEYFAAHVQEDDYVCTTWRSHYHCLLKGVPEDQLFEDIMDGKSITLNYPAQRVISSAIVGGIIPIALGLAWAVKREGKPAKLNEFGHERAQVHCFMGDMTARTGIKHECAQYAQGFGLPITFVVEDNGKSVCTPTDNAWSDGVDRGLTIWSGKTYHYRYHMDYPHSGAGKRVEF